MSPAGDEAVLAQRASALARPVATVGTATTEVVIMSVAGGRRYALATNHVRGVVRNVGLCRVPASDGELRGILLVKGDAVPVADLSSLFGLSGPDLDRPLVVVLDGDSPPVGLLVDDVVSAEGLFESDLRLLHRGAPGDRQARLERGVTTDGVVVLDDEALLGDPRLYADAGTTSDQPDQHE